ncbi:MAG: hypothetical protein KDB23_32170, partial [Planctomycetales bacterium]|nr:hypothetical protein [Planctomycetales bacterium]
IVLVHIVYHVLNATGVETRRQVLEFAVQRTSKDGEFEYLDVVGNWKTDIHAAGHSRSIADAFDRIKELA